MLLGHQRRCFTYVSVTPTMGESGLAKLNLHVDDWRHPDDRARYLDAMAPELIAGDPISFAELLTLPMTHRPAALMSVSMMLLPGMRARLEQRFDCPVLDIYSLNEVGPVAVYDDAAGGHVLLQHRLYVEILDGEGKPGARGSAWRNHGHAAASISACRCCATAPATMPRWRTARMARCWWGWPGAARCATAPAAAPGSTISTSRTP